MKRLSMAKKAGPVAALGLAAALVLTNGPGGTAANQDDGQFAAVGRDLAAAETVTLRSLAVESEAADLAVLINDPTLRPVAIQPGGQSNEAAGEGGGAVVHDPASIMGIFVATGQESDATDLTVREQDPASIALPASQITSEAESTTAEFVVRDPVSLGGPTAGGTSSEAGSDAADFVQRDIVGISDSLSSGPSVEASADDGQFVRRDPASRGAPTASGSSSESGGDELTVVEHTPGTFDVLSVGAVTTESESSDGTFVQHGNRVRTFDLDDQATRTESEAVEGSVVVHDPVQVSISIGSGPAGESEEAEAEVVDRDLVTISQGLRAAGQASESGESGDGGFTFVHPNLFGGSGLTIGVPTSESESSQATFVVRGGTDLTEVDLPGEND